MTKCHHTSRMLKKHALSIAEGSTRFVLGALGGPTYRTEYAGLSLPQPSPKRLLSRRQVACYTAALDGLFDHPAGCSDAVPDFLQCCVATVPKWLFNNLLDSEPSLQPGPSSVMENAKARGTPKMGTRIWRGRLWKRRTLRCGIIPRCSAFISGSKPRPTRSWRSRRWLISWLVPAMT